MTKTRKITGQDNLAPGLNWNILCLPE